MTALQSAIARRVRVKLASGKPDEFFDVHVPAGASLELSDAPEHLKAEPKITVKVGRGALNIDCTNLWPEEKREVAAAAVAEIGTMLSEARASMARAKRNHKLSIFFQVQEPSLADAIKVIADGDYEEARERLYEAMAYRQKFLDALPANGFELESTDQSVTPPDEDDGPPTTAELVDFVADVMGGNREAAERIVYGKAPTKRPATVRKRRR